MLVVDASATVNACMARQGFEVLSVEELTAPPLLWSEAESVIHELKWRRSISEELASAAFARLQAAPIRLRRPRRLSREAWAVAEELGWAKTYDAEYVALARLLGCRLLTIDARLQRGASRLVTIVGPTEI